MKNFIALLIVAAVWSSCGSSTDKKSELADLKKQRDELNSKIEKLEAEISKEDTSKSKRKVWNVAVMELKPQQFKHYVEIQGKVDADQNVTISPEIGGTVISIHVHEGDPVMKGQMLAELDSKVMKQALEEIQTQLDLATTLFNKQKNLWDKKIGTEVQFLSAKATMEALQKRKKTTEEQIKLSFISSPINGVVDEVMIKEGQLSAPGYPAFRLVNTASLKVNGAVAESYAGHIRKGIQVILNFPDISDSVETTLSYVAKVIDPMNRTFNVEAKLGSGIDYHPNMVVVMKINDYEAADRIVIPSNTIQHNEEGDFVYVAEGKSVKRMSVKTGMVYNGHTEIIDGLKTGDQLITAGYQEVNTGDPITY